jgi:hypothetical protein
MKKNKDFLEIFSLQISITTIYDKELALYILVSASVHSNSDEKYLDNVVPVLNMYRLVFLLFLKQHIIPVTCAAFTLY